MFTNGTADPGSGRSPGGTPRKRAFFDFVIAQRPVYIPNSGPPLAPISIMPANDKDGIILDTLQLDGSHVYVVGYKDNPHLRISVKPENIRNWVSERTHEQWDRDQVQLRKDEERRIREENRKKKKGSGSREGLPEGVKGKPGRKRKRAPSPVEEPPARRASALGSTAILPPPSGPGRRRKPVEEEPVFASPKAQKSQGPSLSTPVKGLADLDTDDEDMDDNAALDLQLNGGIMQSSRSTTGTSRRSSRGTSLMDDSRAVANTSSRAARQIYEDLDARSKKDKSQTITEKYSNLKKPSSQFSPRPGMFSPPKDNNYKSPYTAGSPSKSYKSPYPNAANPNPANRAREYGVEVEEDEVDLVEALSEEGDSDSETEYEIDKILDDGMRRGEDGKRRLHYLIKWEGTYDDTWEPAINVGEEAIKEYKEMKRKEGRSMNLDGTHNRRKSKDRKARVENESDEGDEDHNALFVTDRKGKGKAAQSQPARGQVIDDYSDDSD